MVIEPIAHIKNDFKSKFTIPRQSGIVNSIKSKIVFEKEYQDANAIRGIEGFSHLWLIWCFDESIREKHSLTVRPPRLGGNERVGVFASRSPFRPNNLGLSSVKLDSVEYDKNGNPYLIVSGADLKNDTPLYDIKPYIKFTDSHEDAKCGFVDDNAFHTLKVINSNLLNDIEKKDIIVELLSNDVRPAYQDDENRIYGFYYAEYEIRFKVKKDELTIIEIKSVE